MSLEGLGEVLALQRNYSTDDLWICDLFNLLIGAWHLGCWCLTYAIFHHGPKSNTYRHSFYPYMINITFLINCFEMFTSSLDLLFVTSESSANAVKLHQRITIKWNCFAMIRLSAWSLTNLAINKYQWVNRPTQQRKATSSDSLTWECYLTHQCRQVVYMTAPGKSSIYLRSFAKIKPNRKNWKKCVIAILYSPFIHSSFIVWMFLVLFFWQAFGDSVLHFVGCLATVEKKII